MRIFVITGRWEAFCRWCRDNGLRPRDAVFVNLPERLLGKAVMPDDRVVRLPVMPYDLPGIEAALAQARLRGEAVQPVSAAEQAAIVDDLLSLWREVS